MKQKKTFGYSIMKDSHMYYFLQSASKVRQLLATGLYKLDGNILIEMATKQTLEIDEYIANKVRQSGIKQVDPNEEFNRIINSEKFKMFEQQRQRLKKMKIGEKSSESKSVKSSRIAEIDKIKGLKEFMGKNLK